MVPPTLVIPVLGGGNTWNPGVLWPVSLAYVTSSRPVTDPVLQTRGGWCLRNDTGCRLASTPDTQHTLTHLAPPPAHRVACSGGFSDKVFLFSASRKHWFFFFCLFVLGKCYFYDNYFDLPGALLCAKVVDSLTKVSGHSVLKHCSWS